LSICDSATPAMPAMPEPSAKVIMSIQGVRMPMAAAMRRFWVTARICQPEGRGAQHEEQRREDAEGEDDDPEPAISDADIADQSNAAAHVRRRADLAVVRAEIGAHRLLQDEADAPGGEQRFQRPSIEPADHGSLDERCRWPP
jgi:hypothetical protein